jgi:hypothetical protein
VTVDDLAAALKKFNATNRGAQSGDVDIDKNYEITRHHAPDDDGIRRITNIRIAAKQFLDAIDDNVPPSADQSAAKRKVREAMMTANAAIVLKGVA